MEKFQLATLSDSHPLVNEIRDVLEKGTQQKIAFLQVDKMKKMEVYRQKTSFLILRMANPS